MHLETRIGQLTKGRQESGVTEGWLGKWVWDLGDSASDWGFYLRIREAGSDLSVFYYPWPRSSCLGAWKAWILAGALIPLDKPWVPLLKRIRVGGMNLVPSKVFSASMSCVNLVPSYLSFLTLQIIFDPLWIYKRKDEDKPRWCFLYLCKFTNGHPVVKGCILARR